MTSTSSPAAEQRNTAAPKVAIYLLGAIAGLQLIDPSVANVAIVKAGAELQFSGSVRALAASISTLALAATVLASGIAADRLGRRRILVWAMLLAVAGDVLVALTPVTAGYLAGRALAGIGVGAALAATFAYVRFVTPPERLGSALGMWNAIMLALMIVGVLIGGALADSSWRIAMLLVPVLALLLVPLVSRLLPPMPRSGSGRVDVAGLVVVGGSMVLLLLGISNAAGSATSPSAWGLILVGLAGFALWTVIEAHSANPAFPIRLFRQPIFLAAVLAGIGWNFGQAVIQLSSSNFWQYVSRFGAFDVSVWQMPLLATTVGGSLLVGRWLTKQADLMPRVLAVGFSAFVLGYVALTLTRSGSGGLAFLPGMLLIGIGIAAVSVPQSMLFVSSAPADFFGAVTSFRTTVGQLGYAIGLAGSVALVQLVGQFRFLDDLASAGVATSQGIDEVRLYIGSGNQPTTEAARTAIAAAGDAYSAGFNATMLISAGVLAVIGVATLSLLARSRRRAKGTPADRVS